MTRTIICRYRGNFLRGLCLAALLLSVRPTGYSQENGITGTHDPIPEIIAQVAESTYASHLLGLQAFGTRDAFASNHDSVAAWIAGRFLSFGFTDVVYDSFAARSSNLMQRNVIATIHGSEETVGEVVIGAHYDSRSSTAGHAPGADDNASGTAAVLEMARVMQSAGYRPKITVRFAAFAAEEAGLLGSQHYAGAAMGKAQKIIQMQNYDMIGYLAPGDVRRQVFVIWYDGARDIAEKDSAVMRAYTTLTPVLSTSYRSQSDSWYFSVQGYKAFFNIEYTFNPFYHTTHDSATALTMSYAVEVTRSGLALLIDTDSRTQTHVPFVDAAPSGMRLEQNYPNPFNPSTTIGYTVPGTGSRHEAIGNGWVRLSVHDILGREVAVLVDEKREPGDYTVTWNAAGLASGVYLCRLTAGDAARVKRMLLLR